MRGIADDWLSCTIRTVEAVMAQHGFVDDIAPQLKLPATETDRSTGINCFAVLTCFVCLRLPPHLTVVIRTL